MARELNLTGISLTSETQHQGGTLTHLEHEVKRRSCQANGLSLSCTGALPGMTASVCFPPGMGRKELKVFWLPTTA